MTTTTKANNKPQRRNGVPVTFVLPYEILQRLEAKCAKARITRSEYVRNVVEAHLGVTSNPNKQE